MNADNIRRRFTVGVAWMFAGIGAEQVCTFLVVIIMARLLGAEAYGLVMMAMIFITLAEFLVRETITDALIQQKDLQPGHLDAVFWSMCGISGGLALCIVVFADSVASLYAEPRVAEYLIWLWPTVVFIGVSGVPVAILRRNLEFRMLAVRATAGIVAGGTVGITMAVLGYGPWSLIGQRLVQVAVNNILPWFAVDWRPGLKATRGHIRDIRGFSANMLGLRTTELLSVQTPTFLIGTLLGPVALGQFTIAWRIVEALSFVVVTPVRFVAQPAFASMQRSADRAAELLRNVTEVSALFTFACFMGLAAVAGPTIAVLLGPGWEPTAPVLRILCLVGVFLSIERLQQAYCLALGRAGQLFALSFAELLLGVALMFVAVQYSLILVAAAFTARYYLLWPARFYIVKKVAGVNIWRYAGIFVLPIAVSSIMTAAILGWQYLLAERMSVHVLLFSTVLVGGLVYAGGVWIAMAERVRRVIAFVKSMGTPAREREAGEDRAEPGYARRTER